MACCVTKTNCKSFLDASFYVKLSLVFIAARLLIAFIHALHCPHVKVVDDVLVKYIDHILEV